MTSRLVLYTLWYEMTEQGWSYYWNSLFNYHEDQLRVERKAPVEVHRKPVDGKFGAEWSRGGRHR